MSDCLNHTVIDELRLIMGDDVGFLFSAYLEDTAKRLVELQNAINDKDCDLTRRVAHCIKGSSKNVGATRISELCESLERAARSEVVDEWPSLLVQIEAAFETTKQQIEQQVLSI